MGANLTITLCTGVAFLALITHGIDAHAQTPSDGGEALQEIIVTANKREQRLQDVPASITAFSAENLQALGVAQPLDLAAQTPGLIINNQQGGAIPTISVRGIGLDDWAANNDPSVSVYVDDVVLTSAAMLSFSLFDIERVEILKGPQGTLYGRNATGGAVKFYTKRPTSEFSGHAEGELIAGPYFGWRGEAAIGGPLSDSLRARLAGTLASSDHGWQKSITTGKHNRGTNNYAVRGGLDFDIGESANLLISAEHGKDRSGLPHWVAYAGGPDAAYASGINENEAYFDERDRNRINNESWKVAAHFSTDLGGANLNSITSYHEFRRRHWINDDGRAGNLYNFFFRDNIKAFSQELRLDGESGPATWVTGLFYADDSVESYVPVNLSDALTLFGGPSLPIFVDVDYVQDTKALGAFAHAETRITDELRLTTAIRYSWERRSFIGDVRDRLGSFGLLVAGSMLPPGYVFATQDETQKRNNVTWKIGIDYKPRENILVYGNASTGFKSGIYFGGTPFSQKGLEFVQPEKVLAFEIGTKTTLIDRTLTLNAAAFLYDYKNKQGNVIDCTGGIVNGLCQGSVNIIDNIDKSRIKGAEADLHFRPLDGLDLRVGLAYLDTKVTKYNPRVVSPVNAVGQRLANAPEWTANGLVRYRWSLSNSYDLALGSDFNYTGSQLGSIFDPYSRIRSIIVVNARATLSAADDSFQISAWIKNIGNERTLSDAFPDFLVQGTQVALWNAPRTYGLTASFNF